MSTPQKIGEKARKGEWRELQFTRRPPPRNEFRVWQVPNSALQRGWLVSGWGFHPQPTRELSQSSITVHPSSPEQRAEFLQEIAEHGEGVSQRGEVLR